METKRHLIISRALIIPKISILTVPYGYLSTNQSSFSFGKADMVIIIKHLDQAHLKCLINIRLS